MQIQPDQNVTQHQAQFRQPLPPGARPTMQPVCSCFLLSFYDVGSRIRWQKKFQQQYQQQQQQQMQHQQFQQLQQQQRFQHQPAKPNSEEAIKQSMQVTDYSEEEQLSQMDRQVLDQTISQATTLLAQQLSNKSLNIGESVEKQLSSMSETSEAKSNERTRNAPSGSEEMDNLEDPSDLGGLEVDGDEVMGLDEDFDIMEFADAIDNLEHQNEGDKNDLEKKEKRKMSVVNILSSDEPPSIPLAQGDHAKQQQPPQQKVTQQPPPYTVVTTAPPPLVRGPPPPYPGQNLNQTSQPAKVSVFRISLLFEHPSQQKQDCNHKLLHLHFEMFFSFK